MGEDGRYTGGVGDNVLRASVQQQNGESFVFWCESQWNGMTAYWSK